jgi:uncharacterized membrane protein YqiK
MSWIEDELRRQREQEAERQRQEAEQQRQEQEVATRREQAEAPLRDQRKQQLDQMARQQLASMLRSLQLPQLVQETNRYWRNSSCGEDFHYRGNYWELNEPLGLTGWEYSVWLEINYNVDIIGWQEQSAASSTLRIRLWRDENTKTRIAVEEIRSIEEPWQGFPEGTFPLWEEEIIPSNPSQIVARLKDSILDFGSKHGIH